MRKTTASYIANYANKRRIKMRMARGWHGGGRGGKGSSSVSSCAEYGPVHEEIDGMTALMRASSQGDEACAVELIAAGASVDVRDSQEGFTALLMASAMGASRDRAPRAAQDWPAPHRCA